MVLKPGCGCIVLLLSFVNLMFAAISIWGLASGRIDLGGMSLMTMVMFFANFGICFSVGWVSFTRGKRKKRAAFGDGEEGFDEMGGDDSLGEGESTFARQD